jgi:YVTN family beta-propeller protein
MISLRLDPRVVRAALRRGRLGPVVALLAAAAGGCRGDAPPPAPVPQRVYVSNETAGTVAVIDPVTGNVIGAIPVGKRPRGLRVSRDGKQLYVALSGSPIAPPGVDESSLPAADRSADGIAVIDIATRKAVRTIHSGQDPETFDLSPDGRWLYVSNEETAEISVVDLQAGTVTQRVKVGDEPEGVTVSPDGKVVYVACEADHSIVAVDSSSFATLGRVMVGQRPRSIAVTPDGGTLFVTNENSWSISVLNAARHTLADTIRLPKPDAATTPPRPMGAVLSPDAKLLFVSNGRAKSVSVIDVEKRTLLRTLADVGLRPWGIGVSADGSKLFTANGPAGDVSIVDVATGAVERRISLGGSPWGIAVAAAP